jgi:hypothetical protein
MMFATPELFEAEPVEVRGEVEISLELQGGVFAERVVRGEERAELEAGHS